MTPGRTRDPILRGFLRAAAIAFALGADSLPVLADDEMPEAPISSSAQTRATGHLREALRDGQLATASMTLEPIWRGVPDPEAQLRLLDARGHKLLQSPVHGRCSFSALPAGPCTLLVKVAGHTTIRRIDLATGQTTVVALEMDR